MYIDSTNLTFEDLKKSARFARTVSSRASRAGISTPRARASDRCASRSDIFELRASRSVLRVT